MIGIKLIKNCGLISFAFILFGQAGFATDSSSLTPGNAQPNTIILYDSGYLMSYQLTPSPYSTGTNSTIYYFKTNRSCPPSFGYFIQVIPTMAYSGSAQAISSFGSCVYFVFNYISYYTVDVLLSKQNVLFDSSGIHGINSNPDNPSGLYWNLYCYPPGMPGMTVQTNYLPSGGNGQCVQSSDTPGTAPVPF